MPTLPLQRRVLSAVLGAVMGNFGLCPARGTSVARATLGTPDAHAARPRMLPVCTSVAHATLGTPVARATRGTSVAQHDDGHRAVSCATELPLPRLRVFVLCLERAHGTLGTPVAHATIGTPDAHAALPSRTLPVGMSVAQHDDGHRAVSCATELPMPRLRVFVLCLACGVIV